MVPRACRCMLIGPVDDSRGLKWLLHDYLSTCRELGMYSVKSLGAPKLPFESRGPLAISYSNSS